ncbi:3-hydroxyacyl-CoA dehydrogenase NAD-binding domain-containing protein [Pseudopedobacter beijingensis]|uniref:3-hydroxyacyl-CoA dehydrogenase NAD-binding domain-containing protein n=1 Tax=Pseudopedobacter beijingensis TaxID=1207056 RepID=A0ABW4IGK8_9SPHI
MYNGIKINKSQHPEDTGILVIGDTTEAISIVVCLLSAGHPVNLLTKNEDATDAVKLHFEDVFKYTHQRYNYNLNVIRTLQAAVSIKLAIVVTDESLSLKRELIGALEKVSSEDLIIAVNTESIPLSDIQLKSLRPHRIIGANWAEPAHTTYFLELISNHLTNENIAQDLEAYARKYWGKDPYLILSDKGIRSKMTTAMVREAFYLVENGYATMEDIDRACRNDAGFYLPFAGNFRYMDLMGTSAYGMVMKDLNPELSNETVLPEFFKAIIAKEESGFNNNSLYELSEKADDFRKFSYEIQKIIEKYPKV